MTKLKIITVTLLFSVIGITSCGIKQIEKNIEIDITKYNKKSFNGLRGEKFSIKLNGKFSGSIKFAMVSNSNKLTAKNFTVFKDSINVNMGEIDIYQDNTGFT